MERDKDPFLLDSNKMLWHMNRVLQWEQGRKVPPILIDIGLTKYCNCRCIYCYGEYQQQTGERIPDQALLALMADAPRLGVKALTLTGDGEPTLHPKMYEALEIGKQHGLDIGIATNGIKLDAEKINRILNTSTWIRVNLSAGTKDSYKIVHGINKFDTVIDNLATLVALKNLQHSETTVGVQMVLVPSCLGDVIPLAELAVKLGVDYFVIKQFSDPIDDNIPASGVNHKNFVEEAMPVLCEAQKLSTDRTKIVPKFKLMALHNKRAYPFCIDLPFILQISGNSKAYPCGYLFNRDEYCYGNLKAQTLEEIITSDRYWNIINTIATMPTSRLCPYGCCRHDSTNAWLTNYVNKPKHINFI